jgi:hypothetical protein
MSKSVRRVEAALEAAGIAAAVREMPSETRTAQQAADAVGVTLDQIVKSIIFRGEASGEAVLFLTAGGNQVDAGRPRPWRARRWARRTPTWCGRRRASPSAGWRRSGT